MTMIDKNEQNTRPQTQDPRPRTEDARPKKDRILRAKDIIPGAEQTAGNDEESVAKEFDIPRFNLAQDILSAQRRQITVRRKGPEEISGYQEIRESGNQEENRGRDTSLVAGDSKIEKTEYRTKKAEWRIEVLRDSIIAEIVARDIGRLCAGH